MKPAILFSHESTQPQIEEGVLIRYISILTHPLNWGGTQKVKKEIKFLSCYFVCPRVPRVRGDGDCGLFHVVKYVIKEE